MKLSEVKQALNELNNLTFKLENGTIVPEHFHITEVGIESKEFIDCGGTIRNEKKVIFQLWYANDYNHRLEPSKLLSIIELSEKLLPMEDLEVEAEYQSETIGKYALGFDGKSFVLQRTTTACLAMDKCGIPEAKPKIKLSELNTSQSSCCTPGGGCC
jgi:hypothetical protein